MKPETTDPEQMTDEQARVTFDAVVQEIMRDDNKPFVDCWQKARALYPKLFERVCQPKQPEHGEAAPLPNAFYAEDAPMAVTVKPSNLVSLGLPSDATDDEYRAAFMANGRRATPRNSQNILTALVAHQLKKNGGNMEMAKDAAKTRYQKLWAESGEKPMPPRI